MKTCSAFAATLRQNEVPIKLEPLSTPVCRMAVVLDPDGNAIMLHQATQEWQPFTATLT
jgi:predicted enzyme related to lactoylglutathione lyase